MEFGTRLRPDLLTTRIRDTFSMAGLKTIWRMGQVRFLAGRCSRTRRCKSESTPAQGHSGNRSLRLYFQVRSHIDTINVSQLVPVKPNTEYDFECYVKTERLESAETPVIVDC